ncbi:MAG TPA: PQQ-dependent sugar dehydrogenase [Longimicrobium sp.]|nr:PQQ-dependent sugar dehydrogenase [Longimicrobium sp.]
MMGNRSVRALVPLLAVIVAACDNDGPGVLNPLPDADREVALQLVAQGLTSPIALMEPPDGTGRLFVVDQAGLIRIIAADGTLLAEPFLDVRSRMVTLRTNFDERGLLGLAFHPNYRTNGRFYVYYSAPLRAGAPAGYDHTATISEFRVSASANRADASSERIVLRVDKPQFNHNGGTLAFGPDDGYLYISLGDGGGANDTPLGHVDDWYAENGGGNGQDITQNLLGNILRIDVDGGTPYGIPGDNPFRQGPGLDEIYAYGFRNPYRFSFDMGGRNDLLVGDAGQGLWEEVSRVQRGGNYGWNVKEGTHCFDAENNRVSPASCPTTDPTTGVPLTDPVIEYAHLSNGGLGLVVVGGYVYRGDNVRQLRGRYIFGDWSRAFATPDGTLFTAAPRSSGMWPMQELIVSNNASGRLGHYLLGFGQDADGEVYVLTTNNAGPTGSTGRVYRIADAE